MPEPSADLVEWAPGDYPEVIDPETLLPTSWSEQPRRDDAGRDAQAALGFEADIPTPSEPVNAYVELLRLWAIWARDEVGRDRFGDGSDGDHTVVGTETLTGPAFYNDLEIPTGTVLEPRGWPIYVRGVLSGDGTIDFGGGDASTTTGGSRAGVDDTMIGRGGEGGNAGTPGSAGEDRGPALGGNGGSGGNQGGGGSAGGGNGTGSLPAADHGGADIWRTLEALILGRDTDGSLIQGGSGGGGGGGAGGGGGGAGADVLGLFVHTWAFEGTLDGRGGNGAAGTSGNGGGGGSGGGGVGKLCVRRGDFDAVNASGLWTVTATVAGVDYVFTVDVRAGTAGAAHGTGFAGSVGTAGRLYIARG